MKKLFIVFYLMFLSMDLLWAQPQQHRWMLPDQNIDFSVDPPAVHDSPGNTSGNFNTDVSNGVHGPNGELLFYINRGHVVNRLGQDLGPLTDGTTSLSAIDGEIVIVPVRNNPCLYHIIYTEMIPGPYATATCPIQNGVDRFTTYYATVDMSMNGQMGGFAANGVLVENCTSGTTSA